MILVALQKLTRDIFLYLILNYLFVNYIQFFVLLTEQNHYFRNNIGKTYNYQIIIHNSKYFNLYIFERKISKEEYLRKLEFFNWICKRFVALCLFCRGNCCTITLHWTFNYSVHTALAMQKLKGVESFIHIRVNDVKIYLKQPPLQSNQDNCCIAGI